MNTLQGVTIKNEPNMFENYSTENSHGDDDPGSRCGEIYVANNAKKWTFICTFCDKSVREIDEFISHIKYAHVNLPPPLPIEPAEPESLTDSTEHSTSMKHEVPSFNPLDKTMPEFVDYNDFLDVNVSTVPEVILSECNGIKDTQSKELTPQIRIKSEPESEKEDKEEKEACRAVKRTKPTVVKLSARSMLPMAIGTLHQMEPKPRRQRNKKGRSRRKQIKGPAYCGICNRSFQYYSLYRNHMVKHTSETPFQCTVCKKGFKSKQAIRYHMTTHQREKNFQCEICEAGFYHEWQFVAHMEIHRSENNHPCEVCGKINRTKSEKDIHMRTHTGDRPFGCEFCLKRFRLRHHLSNHLKLHLTYRCDYCRTQFSNGVPLKKPYACPDCFVDVNSLPKIARIKPEQQLQRQQETVEESDDDEAKDVTFHPILSPRDPEAMKPHTCKICHKTYANKRGLNIHISTKH